MLLNDAAILNSVLKRTADDDRCSWWRRHNFVITNTVMTIVIFTLVEVDLDMGWLIGLRNNQRLLVFAEFLTLQVRFGCVMTTLFEQMRSIFSVVISPTAFAMVKFCEEKCFDYLN